ncbi:MAG: small multi-drug export protein, partial [Clostridia bacterium]|nr:small multi-drug export protein [Clostridia bacterium]
MVEFIQNLVGNDKIATLIMSFIPLIELKGGIIFARGAALNFFESFSLAYVGSTIAFIPVFFLLVPILNLLKKIKWFNAFADKTELFFKEKADGALKKAEKNGKKARTEKFYKMLGTFIFVAIPLPMTGVWTGTAVAVFLGLKFKDAVLPVVIGNFIAGAIISVLAEIIIALSSDFAMAKTILDGVLWGLFALAAVMLIIVIVKISLKKKSTAEEK